MATTTMAPATRLTDRDLADLAALSATPLGFAQLASRGRYDAPPHVRLIHDRLLALARRRITRLMIFAGPRHGKSDALSHYFPAWYLGMHPDHRILLASYGADFAATWGRKARDEVELYGPLLYGVGVRPDSSAADAWNIAGGHAGGMNTAGVGGSQTGRGADLLILDDPFKNAEEALSPTYREKLWDWYQAVARTRLEPGAIVALTMTRWHEEDLAGKIIEQMMAGSGEDWHILSLPAIAEDDERIPFLCSPSGEVYTRRAGEPLWPERFDTDALAAIRNTLESSFWWHALYQQRPTPHGGAIFQRAWFDARRYPSLDAIPHLHTIVLSVDSAFQEGVANDYSVIAVWGTDGRDYYLLDVWRARVAYPDLIAAICDVYAKWQPFGPGVAAVLIEKKASGQSAIQTLRRETHLPVIGVEPKGSKVARAELVSPLFHGERVVFPQEVPWLADVIDEHVRFPRGKHDDIVDTSSQALTHLRSRGALVADLTVRLAARTAAAQAQGTQPPRAPWSFGGGGGGSGGTLEPTPDAPTPARHTLAHPGLLHPENAPPASATAPAAQAPSADLLAALHAHVDARQQQQQQQQQSSAADPSFVWPWS